MESEDRQSQQTFRVPKNGPVQTQHLAAPDEMLQRKRHDEKFAPARHVVVCSVVLSLFVLHIPGVGLALGESERAERRKVPALFVFMK